MEDREAIRELPLKYCHLVWKKDVPAIVNLFTEDGEFDAGGAVAPAKGRAGLLKAYNEGLGLDPRPLHSQSRDYTAKLDLGKRQLLLGSARDAERQKYDGLRLL